MKVFVDSPLLIYLNTVAEPGARAQYESFYLDLLSRYSPYTDVLVLDELIYVSRTKYGVPYSVTLDFVESIVLPYVRVLSLGEEEYRQAARLLLEYNVKPSDALHLAVALNNGIGLVVSEDRDFDRVPLVRRVWL